MSEADFAEGKAFVIGPCLLCRQRFSFNPLTVYSFPWPPPDGPREPICRPCIVNVVNPDRARRGLAPYPIPPGAYFDEDAP
jgi:hypothetical protein